MGLMGKKIHDVYYFSNESTFGPTTSTATLRSLMRSRCRRSRTSRRSARSTLPTTRSSSIFSTPGLFTQGLFNGPVFEDRDKTVDPLIGFSLQTNMHGLTRKDIEISEDGLTADFHSLGFMPDTYVWITLRFGPKRIIGTDKSETLKGSERRDWILGAGGKDNLYGMGGNDIFVCKPDDYGKDSASADTIFDFSGDRIDLSRIDANPATARDDTFSLIGDAHFSKRAGQLRFEAKKGDTWIYGDLTGDGKSDLAIQVKGAVELGASDFIL